MPLYSIAMKTFPGRFCLVCVFFTLICSSCVSPQKRAKKSYEAAMRDLNSGSQKAAVTEFSRAIELDPKLDYAYMGRAAARIALKDFAGAATDYSKVIESSPSNEPAFFLRGICKLGLKDFTNAIADFNTAIALDPDDAKAYNYRGLVRVGQRDLDGAVADFTKAIELDPQEATAYRNRAGIEGILKEYEKAVADASKAIELNAKDEFSYRFRSHAKSLLKDRAGALADSDKAIELKPSDDSAWATRGVIKLEWDDFDGASADLEKALQMNPKSAPAYAGRGLLERKRGDNNAALADFNRALELATLPLETGEIHELLGHLHNDMFQWQPALEEFRTAVATNPHRDYLRFRIFLVRSRLGETEEAGKELDAYVKSLPAAKAQDWTTSIGRFLTGNLAEEEFMNQATSTAKRPTDVNIQICEAYYYSGMKHLLAGDKDGAGQRFQKCLDTGEDNCFEYRSAGAELRALKNGIITLTYGRLWHSEQVSDS